jgi:TonB family protein
MRALNARIAGVTLAALAISSAVLHAQCPAPSELKEHVTPIRVKWNVGNLLVESDSIHGVNLWFVTNQSAHVDGRAVQRQFDDQFVPDSLADWIVLTRQLIDLKAPLPNDTSTVVTSGFLRGINGGGLAVARIRQGRKLSDRVRVLMVPRKDTTIMIELDRSSVDTLLNAVEASSRRSGYRHIPGVDDTVPTMTDMTPVRPLPTKYRPQYPSELQQRGIQGEVWTRFCVDVDGRPDLSTFWAQLSDDEQFEQSVRRFLRLVRYEPATLHGAPIRQMVSQRFVFALR